MELSASVYLPINLSFHSCKPSEGEIVFPSTEAGPVWKGMLMRKQQSVGLALLQLWRQLWSCRMLLSSSLELGGLGWGYRPLGEARVPLGKDEVTKNVLLAAGTKKVIINKAVALRCESRESQHCQITMEKLRHRWRDRHVSPKPTPVCLSWGSSMLEARSHDLLGLMGGRLGGSH